MTQPISLNDDSDFTLALSAKELEDITENKMRTISLDVPDTAYDDLSDKNKRALIHLVRAASILDDVFLKQDHPDNIRAKETFAKAAATGNKTIERAARLFYVFNGVEGINMYTQKSEPLRIFTDKELTIGRGFYPQDITEEELAAYVLQHPEQASAIFSNNTIIQRDGDRLIAIPYSVAFREEMEGAARELLEAAKETDHDGLAEYLIWQAQALVNDSDPEMVFNAEKSWISLEDSPLEFTISREPYNDSLSSTVAAKPDVKAMLETYGIKSKNKDTYGIRVGITNKDSYAIIAGYRKHLDDFSQRMPLNDQYRQDDDSNKETIMNFADIDLVALTARHAAIRTGITLSSNLPNDDKLSVQLGEGSRLVFHRQIRKSDDPGQEKKLLDRLVNSEQKKWYNKDYDFIFTVGHELAHSLGPRATRDGKDKKGALGEWGDILEENKADVTSIFMTDYFVEIEKLTQEQANTLYLTWAVKQLPTKQPGPDEPHKFRKVMQLNYFREKGAIQFEAGGKISIVPEKIAKTARQMLEEVIQLQLDGNSENAEVFCKKYGAWNDALQYAADEQMNMKPKLYKFIEQPMRDHLLGLDI